MTSEDDDFERSLMLYSEIETIPKERVEEVRQPRTIRRYNQKIQLNKTASIFDADYSLDAPASNKSAPGCSADLDMSFDEDFGVFKDEKVTYTVSGRGRGGRNIYINPGQPILNKGVNGDDEVRQLIRKVAPIGYGNEITESAVRAHKMSRLMEQNTNLNTSPVKPTSPAASKASSEAASLSPAKSKTKSTSNNASPSLSGKSTPCTSSPAKSKTKSTPNTDSCSSLSGKSTPSTSMCPPKSKTKSIPNTDGRSLSGKSTPCSTASDVQSSDYFTSLDNNVSSGSSKDNCNGEQVDENEDEYDEGQNEFSDCSSASTRRTRPTSSKSSHNGEDEGSLASTTSTRPILPLSVMLKRSREAHKKKQLYRQEGLINDYSRNYDNDIASHRTINKILREDLMEQERRRKLRSSNSSSSSFSSSEVLPWRRRNNSPPKHSWGQADWRREAKQLDINSVDEFPALK